MSEVASSLLSVPRLLAEARQQTGLDDFGPAEFLEPLGILVQSMRDEAQLTQGGVAAQFSRLVNALANRLRKVELLRREPQILDQTVNVAVAIVGLPRTGSTLLHRLLAESPQLTALRWWESIYPLPLAEEADLTGRLRQAKATELAAQIVSGAREFESIHPLDAMAHDEELPLIEQTFMSTLPESMMYLPSYGAWLAKADPRWAYLELVDYLRILQWQRGCGPSRCWVLKAPTHLQFMPTLLDVFPDAVMVMTHRDIAPLMGSWYSMTESLRRANSDAELSHLHAAHWTMRWRESLKIMLAARDRKPERFFDVPYKTLLREPLQVAQRIFAQAGLIFEGSDRAALQGWMDSNPRDGRPAHRYALQDFGIAEDSLAREFAFYTPPC